MSGPSTTSLAILAAMVSAQAVGQQCGEYEVTAIVQAAECPPFGYPPTNPFGINEQGWMVGSIQSCVIGPKVAMLWTPEDGLMVIPMPDGTSYSAAAAISDSLIVGAYDNSESELGRTGFLYDFETDQFTSLGTLPGGNWSEARGINSAGEIVGFWGDVVKGPFPQAFIWREGEMIDIHPDFGTVKSRALDINGDGLVTGWMGDSQLNEARAFIWDNGKVTQLPPLPDGITSEGWSLNSHLDVVGRGRFFDPRLNDIVWRAFAFVDGGAINLGTLPGFDNSFAADINDDQTIVGSSETTSGRALVWRDGEMFVLNDLIPPSENLDIRVARSINEAGQIACSAVNQFNDVVAVLLTPVTGLPGDLNGDCQITVADLLVLLSSWGQCENCAACAADLDNNCVVGVSDLLILLSNWG